MSQNKRTWRELSPWRVSVALICLAATLAGCTFAVQNMLRPLPAAPRPAWFAPYVDVTLTPRYPFEDPASNPAKQVVLAFVVADKTRPCEPSWGGYYGLDEAGTAVDLDRRIARYRSRGGQVVVSFGGAVNDELAVVCDDVVRLTRAYQSVVDRYQIEAIDLDIEGTALTNSVANERRAKAVSLVQAKQKERKKRLDVWLTLPASSSGLTTPGVAVVDTVVSVGLDFAGVNAMTMDFGEAPKGTKANMAALTLSSIAGLARQLRSSYQRVGLPLDARGAWRKIGVTPMIGQNDIAGEVFSLDDAKTLMGVVGDRGLARVSMWSLNRDIACGRNLDTLRAWNTCSGADQTELAFSWLFGSLQGRPERVPTTTVPKFVSTERGAPLSAVTVIDDPAGSPYPIWNADRLYRKDGKVVWRREVYLAKWWNVGQAPDAPIVHEWDSPWRLLGPVLPGERPVPTTTLPPKTYGAWSSDMPYEKHDRVQIGGVGFEAKWWTRGDRPGVDVPNAWNSPWSPITELDEQNAVLRR